MSLAQSQHHALLWLEEAELRIEGLTGSRPRKLAAASLDAVERGHHVGRSLLGPDDAAAKMLDEFGIGYEVEVVSAHRTPDKLMRYAETAKQRGLRVVIEAGHRAA